MHLVAGSALVLAGAALVVVALASVVNTIVLPRGVVSTVSRTVFLFSRRLFERLAPRRRSYLWRDKVYAYYGPLTLILLPAVWVFLLGSGFALIFWGFAFGSFTEAVETSGSSLFTLGFVRPDGLGLQLLTFVEAGLGLAIIAMLISYLPSIYGAFNRRETLVGMIEVRAGSPPWAGTLLTRYARIGGMGIIDEDLFQPWEAWFADVEETHTNFGALVFFRSPRPERSWLIASACVLDSAAILLSTVQGFRSPTAALTLRTGFVSLRHVADFFGIPYDPDPAPTDPISISRREFDLLCTEIEAAGLEVKADRDQAWRDYAGWRVNYDAVLLALCALVEAPLAPWSSDRSPIHRPKTRLFGRPARMIPD